MYMPHEFIIYALLAGVGVVCGLCPMGCVVLWRRIPYFGDAVAHASILGVVAGVLMKASVDPFIIGASILFAFVLHFFKKDDSDDVLVVIFSYSFLSIGLFAFGIIKNSVQVDIFSYLFGDILLVAKRDIYIITSAALLAIAWLAFRLEKLILISLNEDLAFAEGINVKRINLEFITILALLIALSIKVIGALLVASLLVIPAAAARNIARVPAQMLVMSVIVGISSIIGGMFLSYHFDSASGPGIVVVSLGIYLLSVVFARFFKI